MNAMDINEHRRIGIIRKPHAFNKTDKVQNQYVNHWKRFINMYLIEKKLILIF